VVAGWERPVLHGVGFAEGADEVWFVRVNDREDLLAAAVLATVAGWRGATGSVRFGKKKLAQAIERLAPAEACREIDQDLAGDPTLVMARRVRGRRAAGRGLRCGSG
jgi:hypothetical protein